MKLVLYVTIFSSLAVCYARGEEQPKLLGLKVR